MKALDKKLIDTQHLQKGNWIKLIATLKHQSHDWANQRLAREGFSDFKMVYMPIFMNIPPEGINNNELANHARVTKQAMSKVVKELLKLGYIKSKTDPRDKRNTIFMLTDRGKKMVLNARSCVKDLTEEYRKLVGSAEYDRTVDVLKKIIAYNDQKIPSLK